MILAVIAIPAYQSYVSRTYAAGLSTDTSKLKKALQFAFEMKDQELSNVVSVSDISGLDANQYQSISAISADSGVLKLTVDREKLKIPTTDSSNQPLEPFEISYTPDYSGDRIAWSCTTSDEAYFLYVENNCKNLEPVYTVAFDYNKPSNYGTNGLEWMQILFDMPAVGATNSMLSGAMLNYWSCKYDNTPYCDMTGNYSNKNTYFTMNQIYNAFNVSPELRAVFGSELGIIRSIYDCVEEDTSCGRGYVSGTTGGTQHYTQAHVDALNNFMFVDGQAKPSPQPPEAYTAEFQQLMNNVCWGSGSGIDIVLSLVDTDAPYNYCFGW